MAITAATTTSAFSGFLKPETAAPIFDEAAKQSVVQQLVPRIPLGATGVEIPYVTSKPTAGWVAEGAEKPKTEGGLALTSISPKKLAAIFVVSAEVVRANPGNYVTLMRSQLAEAFALAFDAATLHGTSTPFSTYIDQATKAVELGASTKAQGGVYNDFNNALRLLANDKKKLRSWALDDVTEATLNASYDTSGRPLLVFTGDADTNAVFRRGTVLNRPAFIGEGVQASGTGSRVVGYGGDWTKARWGAVGGISYDVSQEATVTINGSLVSLWEKNLVAIRAEAEYGFLVHDTAAFVKITDSDSDSDNAS